VNNVWVWYPCGVACSAGELVEEVSDLSGGVWNVQALYLRAGGGCSSLLVRRNGEYHHGDVLVNKGVITDGSGNVLSSNVYDAFGVSMFTSGSAQTPYRPAGLVLDVEGLDFSGPPVAFPLYTNRSLRLSIPPAKMTRKQKPHPADYANCMRNCIHRHNLRISLCYQDYHTCLADKTTPKAECDYELQLCLDEADLDYDICKQHCKNIYNPSPPPPPVPRPQPVPPGRYA